ncbi:MAG: hypothetical protein J5546_05930 [Lachnospiraceae bacterium]|nr:hypothetical protein [Lachnospiraceae bacterium]
MSESYVECLVKAKGNFLFRALRILMYFFAVLGFVTIVFGLGFFGMIIGLAFGFGGYFIGMLGEVEYEYLYMDKELQIDRILAQNSRKTMATYSMEKVEIMAPIRSYRLENYKNRQTKNVDYSIGYEDQPDRRYVFYNEGQEKVIFSPSEEMVRVMKNANPRKVFSD